MCPVIAVTFHKKNMETDQFNCPYYHLDATKCSSCNQGGAFGFGAETTPTCFDNVIRRLQQNRKASTSVRLKDVFLKP